MSQWNRDAAAHSAKVAPVLPTAAAARQFAVNAAVVLVSLAVLRLGPAALFLVSSPWLRLGLSAICWAMPFIFGARCAEVVALWRSSRQPEKVQASLAGQKRKLFGLSPPKPKVEPLRQRRAFSLNPFSRAPAAPAAAGQAPLMPITPPQRYAGTPMPGISNGFSGSAVTGAITATPGAMDYAAAHTPLSDSMRRSPKPGFSPSNVIASPEQLSYYYDSLSKGAPGGAVQQQAAASPQPNMYGYGPYAPAEAAGVQQDQDAPGAGGMLPIGINAPCYRMTWLPKKAAAVAAPDTALSPTPPEEVEDFIVSVLAARQDWLELWTERLREWLAGRVFGPLVDAVASAHEPVNALLAQFGQQARLPPIPDTITDGRGGQGIAGGAGMAGAGGAGGLPDVDSSVRTLQAMLQQHLATQPANSATAPKAKELLAEVNRYWELLQVLRGKRPCDLLPPSSTAYVWARIQQLAAGTCLKDFTWNGGGVHAGRPWTPDLPSDSALVLYLFAAYIDAPGWQFTSPANSQAEGVPVPLYLGQLGSAPRPSYSAILGFRPERPGRGVDALLGLNLAGASPLFCYLAAGRLLVLANYQFVAVFHSILFFLQYHKVKHGGMMGRQVLSDPDLGLDQVLKPPQVGALVALSHKVFGWLL